MPEDPVVRVAAGVIRRLDGSVLLALRNRNKHQGGLWEFPGGKLEGRECGVDALVRELHEELGIHIEQARPLIRIRHAYPDKRVELEVFEIETWRGKLEGREGQALAWVRPTELARYRFPAANRAIVTACALPTHAVIVRSVVNSADSRHEQLPAVAGAMRLACLASADPVSGQSSRANETIRPIMGHTPLCAVNAAVSSKGVEAPAGSVPANERPLRYSQIHNGDYAAFNRAAELDIDLVLLELARDGLPPSELALRDWQALRNFVDDLPVPVYPILSPTRQNALNARRAGCQGIALTWSDHSLDEAIAAVESGVAESTVRP